MSNKHTHLGMIQGVVNRLSQNSFLLKGWSVVLVSGLFALAAKDGQILFLYLAYLPVLAFWGLDGYFLRQERLFRKLYDAVRLKQDEEVDFSMNTALVDGDVSSWLRVSFSKTLLVFHGVLVSSVTAISLINKFGYL